MSYFLLETSFHFAISRGVHTKRLKASRQFFLKFVRVCALVRARALTVENSRRNMTHNCRACVADVCALTGVRRYQLFTGVSTVFSFLAEDVGLR